MNLFNKNTIPPRSEEIESLKKLIRDQNEIILLMNKGIQIQYTEMEQLRIDNKELLKLNRELLDMCKKMQPYTQINAN